MGFDVQLKVTDKSKEFAAALVDEVMRAAYQWCEDVMGESKEKYVPVNTGRLMGTGKVSEPEQQGSKIVVVMGYNTDYAMAVHEDMSKRHWKRPGSGPKYLEKPAKARQGELAPAIQAACQRASNSI